ncbi:MAG: ISKra4 family transposase [Acidiferrobacteraceae bacterium]
MEAHAAASAQTFGEAREAFEKLVAKCGSDQVASMTHSEVEGLLFEEGTELLRKIYQGYLNSLGDGAVSLPVRGPNGVEQTHRRETGRNLMTRFGPVRLCRMGYGQRETSPVYPLDARLNMPPQLYSFGLEKLIAGEVAKAPFAPSAATIGRMTGARVPKRQVEEVAVHAATDFDRFYEKVERTAKLAAADAGPILVLTADGKGVVMRTEDLRQQTREAAETREHKLTTRLSKGEKRNSKRMAEVAAVYTLQPYVRTPEEIIGKMRPVRDASRDARPRPENKRVWASLKKEVGEVIEDAFLEGLRRDPERRKSWVALVDGNRTQLKLIKRTAKRHLVQVTIVVDFIHVLEYLWKAGHELLGETPEVEGWVLDRARRVLDGEASLVAAGVRRSATKRNLAGNKRKRMDECARYLLKNTKYLRYDTYLKHGYPIATGVIEGACRYLVKDRMDVTGARWGLDRAEAVLQLRALISSSDFDSYWAFHEKQEHQRNHQAAYFKGQPPPILSPPRSHALSARTPDLRLVKS